MGHPVLCRFVNFEEMKKEVYKGFKKNICKALKVHTPKLRIKVFFEQSLDQPPSYPPPHVPDLKCNLEHIPEDKNTFLI